MGCSGMIIRRKVKPISHQINERTSILCVYYVHALQNRHHSSYARTLLKRDACGYAKIVVSTLAHVGILVCFLAAIWMLILHNSVEFLLVPALCAIAFYVTILLEAVTCETHAALRRLDLSQSAESYTDTVRQAAPLVLWKAHAYHYERAESEVNDDNKRRRSPVSLQRMAMAGRRKTTVSCQQNCTLQYESWRDATVNMSGVFLTSIIRVRIKYYMAAMFTC